MATDTKSPELRFDFAAIVAEFVDGDEALGLEAGVHDYVVLIDADDFGGDDFTRTHLLAGEAFFEQCGKAVHGGCNGHKVKKPNAGQYRTTSTVDREATVQQQGGTGINLIIQSMGPPAGGTCCFNVLSRHLRLYGASLVSEAQPPHANVAHSFDHDRCYCLHRPSSPWCRASSASVAFLEGRDARRALSRASRSCRSCKRVSMLAGHPLCRSTVYGDFLGPGLGRRAQKDLERRHPGRPPNPCRARRPPGRAKRR
jgi:hypothetical protein